MLVFVVFDLVLSCGVIVVSPCCRRSFIRSFLIANRGPAYSSADTFVGPLHQPRERRGSVL